jgi:PadR family transcriptional regulator PadR
VCVKLYYTNKKYTEVINTEFKKGILDMLVLSLLRKRPFYGYELVQEISKTINISQGTIYPLLRRLKRDGLVTTYLEESKKGAPRKYYRLTNKGREKLEEFLKEWNKFYRDVNSLLV